MSTEPILVFDGDSTTELDRFEPGSSGEAVLQVLLQLGKGRLRAPNGYTVTTDTKNLPAGIYRWYAVQASEPEQRRASGAAAGPSGAPVPGREPASRTTDDPSTPSRKVLEGLRQVAHALLEAPVDGPYLELPRMLPKELPPPLRTSIFLRKDYHSIIQRMRIQDGGLKTTVVTDDPALQAPDANVACVNDEGEVPPSIDDEVFVGNVLTGPPGSGKSSLAPLALAHLAKHKQTVVYRYFSPKAQEQYVLLDFKCSPPKVDMEYTSTPKRLAAYVRSSETWLLWDGPPKKKGSGQFSGDGPMLVMSSPNDKNYHEFIKGKGAAVLHMNPFSLGEFLRVAPMYKVPPLQAIERYCVFGGVIRPALTQLEEVTAETLRNSVSGADALQLMSLDLVGVRSEISHTLVHLRSDENFRPMYLALASPFVRQIVFEKGYCYNQMGVQRLVVSDKGKPGVAGFAGHMFEQHGHHVFPRGDLRVHMKQLQPTPLQLQYNRKRQCTDGGRYGVDDEEVWEQEGGDDGDQELGDDSTSNEQPSHHLASTVMGRGVYAPGVGQEASAASFADEGTHELHQQLQELGLAPGDVRIPKVKRVWDNLEQDLSELHHVYLQPPTANNASWDAYYDHGDQKYVLQYTVSDNHGVKQEPIRKLLRRLKTSEDRVKMVFVVPALPATLYDNFRWQPWQGIRGCKLSIDKQLKIEQWVMKLPILVQQSAVSKRPSDSATTP